jgi:hypothetical protein
VQIILKVGMSCTFLKKTCIPYENRFELHFFLKCNTYKKKTGLSCTFLERSATRTATRTGNQFGLRISREKRNPNKNVFVLHIFLRKVQIIQKAWMSCTFLEKNATCTDNPFGLYISWKKCSSYRKPVELHISQEKCNSYWKPV